MIVNFFLFIFFPLLDLLISVRTVVRTTSIALCRPRALWTGHVTKVLSFGDQSSDTRLPMLLVCVRSVVAVGYIYEKRSITLSGRLAGCVPCVTVLLLWFYCWRRNQIISSVRSGPTTDFCFKNYFQMSFKRVVADALWEWRRIRKTARRALRKETKVIRKTWDLVTFYTAAQLKTGKNHLLNDFLEHY